MRVIFEAVQNKLDADVGELKMIDFDLGQLEQEPLPSLSYPAVLISFVDTDFVDLSRRNQEATYTVNVRLAFRTFERTHNITPAQYRAVGLAHLDIIEAVKWALHGFSGDDFTSFKHRTFTTEPRADLRVYNMTFETLLSVRPPTTTLVPWGDAQGTTGEGPELCFEDNDGNPIT